MTRAREADETRGAKTITAAKPSQSESVMIRQLCNVLRAAAPHMSARQVTVTEILSKEPGAAAFCRPGESPFPDLRSPDRDLRAVIAEPPPI
jgi:hypothetical protein